MRKTHPAGILSVLLLFNMAVGSLTGSFTAKAETGSDAAVTSLSAADGEEGGYRSYSAAHGGETVAARDAAAVSLNKELQPGGSVTFTAETAAGLYELSLGYRCTQTQDAVLSLAVDGAVPFDEAQRVTFPAYWVNNGEATRDEAGNRYAPEQIPDTRTATTAARDYSGRCEKPYRFSLTAGEHTVTLTVVEGTLVIDTAQFTAPEQPAPYQPPADAAPFSAEPVILEGEDADRKNDRALIALSDAGSASVHPADPVHSQLNYIGGANWKRAGSTVEWRFTVGVSGYYQVGINYRQNQLLGGVSYRQLRIDGITPFAEAERIKFTCGPDWRYRTVDAGNTPCLVYLEAGEHTLSLTATAGPLSDIYAALREITAEMGDLYVDITKIVGETVDPYRSYELFRQIPRFNERLESVAAGLDAVITDAARLQEQDSSSTVSVLKNAVRVVRKMRDNPYSAHRSKSSYYDAYTNLSALLGTMTDTPLDIDRLYLLPAGQNRPADAPSWIGRVQFAFAKFFATFFDSYRQKAGADGDSLTIWVNWGRDQAQVLNAAVQEDFVQKTGIGVQIRVVNATLIQAILSGTGPDCMLQMTRTEPVNLAMRGVLYDLSAFADLDETAERFTAGGLAPYRYDGGVYALPDTESFFLMFLRTDILQNMGLSAPETWDEYIDLATVLQRSNLQAYIPYTQITDSGAANAGVGGMSLYPTLLMQNGLSLYNGSLTACTLQETAQIKIFNLWTDWYTKYKLPVTADFYNRFRTGSMPVGIAPFTVYTQLKAMAPEIEGRWTAVPIPGVRQADGSVSTLSAGSGTGCAITALAQKPENAWRFLKWWTSAETQKRYSDNLESVIGALGRVATSNTEAFAAMGWDASMLDGILAQRENTVQVPEAPGSYYTARGIDQAFWGVVEQGGAPTDLLTRWGEEVNSEMKRKRAEYSRR